MIYTNQFNQEPIKHNYIMYLTNAMLFRTAVAAACFQRVLNNLLPSFPKIFIQKDSKLLYIRL